MPGSEAGHRWLMRLYLDMGRRDAALAQYELCQRSLAVTHGRAPSPETRALQEVGARGRRATPPTTRSDRSADARSPTPSTGAGGDRGDELRRPARGARRARRAVRRSGMPPDHAARPRRRGQDAPRARFRDARSASRSRKAFPGSRSRPRSRPTLCRRRSRKRLAATLPQRGDRAARGRRHARKAAAAARARQLRVAARRRRRRRMPIRRRVVLKILQAAPQVRIVVTSREVLGPAGGMGVRACGASRMRRGNPPRNRRRAFRRSSSSRSARDRRISASRCPPSCRTCCAFAVLVEGLPLGIELAAAWVRTIPCADLAAAIETRGRSARERAPQSPASTPESRGGRRLLVEPAGRRAAQCARRAGRLRRRLHARDRRSASPRRRCERSPRWPTSRWSGAAPRAATTCTSSCGSSRWLGCGRRERDMPRSTKRHAESFRQRCSCDVFGSLRSAAESRGGRLLAKRAREHARSMAAVDRIAARSISSSAWPRR